MKLDDFLKNVKSVAISGHVRPDGDCVGSTLGVYGYIRKNYPDIEADVFIEQPKDNMSFLKYFHDIRYNFDKEKDYDLMICVDCASKERLGKAQKYFEKAAHTINIDHHVSNPGYADENYVFGGLSSCSEALYGFMEPDKLDKDIAEALYMGIVTDTGVFKYEATTPETMRIAGELMSFGLNTNFIIDESFFSKTYNENRILGYAVQKSVLLYDGRLIYTTITNKERNSFNAASNELEGIVAQLRLTKGVQVAIFMHETVPGEYKISFRSNEQVDVNEIAMQFGGGGHIRAAGAQIAGTLEECITRVVEAAAKALV